MIRVWSRPRLVRVSFHQGFGFELKYCLDLRRYDSVSKDLPAILNFNAVKLDNLSLRICVLCSQQVMLVPVMFEVATSYLAGNKFYFHPAKFLPLERFLVQSMIWCVRVRRMLKHLRTPLYLGEGSKQERFLSARYVVLTSELEAIMLSHKSFLINKKLFKKMRHNRPIDR